MKMFVGVTDNDWAQFLAARQPEEVNFWRPGGGGFQALSPYGLFLFKLHSPIDKICGGGYFVRHSLLPVSFAWEVFREANGVAGLDELRRKVLRYRSGRRAEHDPVIGCIALTEPFFWPEDEWIPVPEDWTPNIVRGKAYDTDTDIGLRLFIQVQDRLGAVRVPSSDSDAHEATPAYGASQLIAPRLGQGGFRLVVTEAYHRRCAITGEKVVPVLDAAHIRPYAQEGPHVVTNGVLLRQDLHTLFDRGYMTITDDHHLVVSRRIKEEFGNGKHYYALHGQLLATLPDNPNERPAAEFLHWHNENVYAG